MTDRRFAVTLAALALGLFVGLVAYMRLVQARALSEAEALPVVPAAVGGPGELPPPVPDVASILRALKVITVEIDAPVTVRTSDESWRGDVTATVTAAARLYYGVDLAGLSPRDVEHDLLSGGLVVRVPRPVRLATEVFTDRNDHRVEVGWGRLRDRAGEYYLGLARLQLHDQARRMTLSPAQREQIESLSREQIAGLVRAIVGRPVPVDVRFQEPGDLAGVEAGVPRNEAGR